MGIAALLPKRGRRWRDHRQVIDAIAFKYRTGTPRTALPERSGLGKTAHHRLQKWAADRAWERVFTAPPAHADGDLPIGRPRERTSPWRDLPLDRGATTRSRSPGGSFAMPAATPRHRRPTRAIIPTGRTPDRGPAVSTPGRGSRRPESRALMLRQPHRTPRRLDRHGGATRLAALTTALGLFLLTPLLGGTATAAPASDAAPEPPLTRTDPVSGSSVAIARGADGRLRFFGISRNGWIQTGTQNYPGGPLTDWTYFDKRIHSVSAETNADGRIEVLGGNIAGQPQRRWQTAPGGAWSGWLQSDGQVSSMAVARSGDGRLHHFATGIGGIGVTTRTQVAPGGETWTNWSPLGGSLTRIAADSNADGRIELFGLDSTGEVYHRWQTGGGWSAWTPMGAALLSIAATRDGGGRLHVFGTSGTNELWTRSQTTPGGGWGAWTQLDGSLTQIAAETNTDGRIDLLGIDASGRAHHRSQGWPGGAWTPWVQTYGEFRS